MNGVVLRLRVTPRASRDAIEGVDEQGELRVRVTAPPADGAANVAVQRLLAASLGVPRGAVTLVAGQTGRHKRVRVEGVDPAVVAVRWPGLSLQG